MVDNNGKWSSERPNCSRGSNEKANGSVGNSNSESECAQASGASREKKREVHPGETNKEQRKRAIINEIRESPRMTGRL